MIFIRPLSIIAFMVLATCGCGSATSTAGDPYEGAATGVQFVGNSYTYVNDLPRTFARLAAAGRHRVVVDMAVGPGWTLANHSNSAETLGKISSRRWNVVVLQEQSQIPASPAARATVMAPPARLLARGVSEMGAAAMLFVTWGHRDGWPEQGLPTYEAMQHEIDRGYLSLAQELHVAAAPVGVAWARARRDNSQLELWQGDGSHPTEQGTYLAACVFYAAIFHESPEGLPPVGNLTPATAATLQKVAGRTVLENPHRWNFSATPSAPAAPLFSQGN